MRSALYAAGVLAVIGTFSTRLLAASPRKWTSSTGSQVTAFLLSADLKHETVVLLTTDDRKIALPFDKLDSKDQDFLRQVGRNSEAAEQALDAVDQISALVDAASGLGVGDPTQPLREEIGKLAEPAAQAAGAVEALVTALFGGGGD